jgi:hypothetical protein
MPSLSGFCLFVSPEEGIVAERLDLLMLRRSRFTAFVGPSSSLASFCRKRHNVPVESALLAFFAGSFFLLTRVDYESWCPCASRLIRRCQFLDGEQGSFALAGTAWLTELSPHAMHPPELHDVPVRRAAFELGSVWPSQRTTVCRLRSRRPGARGAPSGGQRAVPCRTC